MAPLTALLLVLLVLMIGALPRWPYSAEWGYAPSHWLGTSFIAVLALWLLERL